MHNQYRYYAVVGTNGAAVMNSYDGVLRMQKYLRKITCKGFNSFRDASDWAYYLLADRFPHADLGLINFQLNRGVFVKQFLCGTDEF